MSVSSLPAPSNSSKVVARNSFHWRNHSGELEVFEAEGYFSGANENPAHIYDFNLGQSFLRSATRLSLAVPKRCSAPPDDQNHGVEKHMKSENKKFKQPSSPGARITSFLNSLFNQKTLKKKKMTSGGLNDIEQEIPRGQRRKRRNNINDFPMTTFSKPFRDSKSMNIISSPGFSSPQTCSRTPVKSCKEFRSYADRFHHVISVPENRGSLKSHTVTSEKSGSRNGIQRKILVKTGTFQFSNHGEFSLTWADECPSEEKKLRRFSDDGADSDSSSDLFDLPNHDSDFCSSTDLPIYETTQMGRIKKVH